MGSFKIRGAANKLLSLTDEERRQGVVTAFYGNHARGVVHARVGVQDDAFHCAHVPLILGPALVKISANPTGKIDGSYLYRGHGEHQRRSTRKVLCLRLI